MNNKINDMYKIMFTDYPDLLNVKQLQSMLSISRHEAYSLIKEGDVPGLLIGNSYRIPKVNVINYVLSNSNLS